MSSSSISLDLTNLLNDGGDLQTSIFDFGQAQIKQVRKRDLSLLCVSGMYTRQLGREIERLALQARSNLGLDFSKVQTNPTLNRKFDPSIVGTLTSIRSAIHGRQRLLFICSPPCELTDLLKLAGVHASYQIVGHAAPPVAPVDQQAVPRDPDSSAGSTQADNLVKKRIQHLNESLTRTVSLEKGLESAEKCVKRFLPQAPPEAKDYSIAFCYKTSERVGGDFFDFISLDDAHLGIVIGDVSGHGLDACLLMGITKKVISLRAQGAETRSPFRTLVQANIDLASDFQRYSFATALYGVIDLPAGKFDFVKAGHENPVIFGPDLPAQFVTATGIPMGVTTGKAFESQLQSRTAEIPPGGFLLLYTDGLPESRSARGACYTREKMLFELRQVDPRLSCQDALNVVLDLLMKFAGQHPQEDDITIILVKRLSPV